MTSTSDIKKMFKVSRSWWWKICIAGQYHNVGSDRVGAVDNCDSKFCLTFDW